MAKIKQNSVKPENIFILFALIFGILLVFLIPPFQVADEPNHFFRSYQISTLQFIGHKRKDMSGGYIPISIKEFQKPYLNLIKNTENKISPNFTLKQLKTNTDYKKLEFTDFRNTVLYFSAAYTPQAIGIAISRYLNAMPIFIFYTGRILNLLYFIILTYIAIKKIPIFKWALTLLALMPMTIYQASSLSVDAFLNSTCFFLIAYIFNCAYSDRKRIKKLELFNIVFFSILVVLTKLAYIFIPFLFLLIPKNKFKTGENYYITFFTMFFLIVVSAFLWGISIQSLYLPANIGVNPHEQFQFILTHPKTFLFATGQRLADAGLWYSMIGNLGWRDNLLPFSICITYLIFFVISILLDENKKLSINFKDKAVIFFITILSILSVAFFIYLSWDAVGAKKLVGVNGRYFIPFLPLLFFIFYNNKFNSHPICKYEKLLIFLILIILITTIICTFIRYYTL